MGVVSEEAVSQAACMIHQYKGLHAKYVRDIAAQTVSVVVGEEETVEVVEGVVEGEVGAEGVESHQAMEEEVEVEKFCNS